ncbi:MAG: Hsp20 family protein [Methylococcales bacterium]|jgi:molecular chaperone IbpA|nr:Hsp20 family protein [Methylococcales bacterium]MBT7445824.1 Hsp20 family protein [Methylococcales bacterium]
MNTFDFSPLYRSSIGFDRVASMMNNAARREQTQPNYPPYNIELLSENQYRITMAIAGFNDNDIDIELEKNTLTITGKQPEPTEEKNYLHHGIAGRSFERQFQLAEHVKVAQASLENGLLHIEMVREIPETLKAKKIAINTTNQKQAALHQNQSDIAA